MRKFLLAALAAVALYGPSAGDAVGRSSNDGRNRWMIIKNESPFTAYQIYMIPTGQDCCWSRDLLEDIFIRRHQNKESSKKSPKKNSPNVQAVNFDDGNETCVVDIRITTREYRGWDWMLAKVDVCTGSTDKEDKEDKEIVLKEIVLKDKGPSGSSPLKVENKSSLTATNVYVIPADQDCCWSHDLLGEKVRIRANEKLEVNFRRACQPNTPLKLDIRVTSDVQGIDWYFDGVDVCNEEVRNSGLTLKGDGKDRWMTVKNETTYQAYSAFIKPSGQGCCWSHDLLGKELPGGKALEVDFDDHTGGCTFDIRITTREGGPEWLFSNVNVCTQSELILP